MKPSTLAAYKTYLARYVIPFAAGLALRDFEISTAARILKDAARTFHLNRATVTKVRSVMSAVFTFALSEGDFPGKTAAENPASHARIPETASQPKPTACPTTAEVKRMLTYLEGLDKAAVALLVYTGIRPGEARGLQWSDWNRQDATLHIQRSRWHCTESTPKTKQSIAFVAVPPELATILTNLWKAQNSPIFGRVLCRADGRAMNLDNASKRTIAPTLSRCAVCQESELAEHVGHEFKRDEETSVVWCGFYGLRRYAGTTVRAHASSDTASKALRNSAAVFDRHYNKPTSVLPDVRRAVESASRLLA